jgi:hypothetical protein
MKRSISEQIEPGPFFSATSSLFNGYKDGVFYSFPQDYPLIPPK